VPVTLKLLHQFIELIARYEIDDLSEDIFAKIHNSAVLAAKLLNQFQIKKIKIAYKLLNLKHINIVKRILSHH
jgi:hypothetical protein